MGEKLPPHLPSQAVPKEKKSAFPGLQSSEWKVATGVENSGRTLLTVSLGEEDYRKALMVQTVSEIVPELVPQIAIQQAEFESEEEYQPGHSLAVRVSGALFDHLPSAYKRLATKEFPWPRLRFLIPLLAFVAGASSNTLSPSGHENLSGFERVIHVFVNPVMLLFFWNLAVVGLFLIVHRRGAVTLEKSSSHRSVLSRGEDSRRDYSRREDERSPERRELPLLVQILLRSLSKLWAHFVELRAVHGVITTTTHARVARLFLSGYFRAFRQSITARVETLINISAICLAAGAVSGMYIQAIMWNYSFYWASTLIHSPHNRLLVAKILFWPAAILLGRHFPNARVIASMAQSPGVSGSMWIHVFALCAVFYILLPRLWLIRRSSSETRRLSAAVKTITIDYILLQENPASTDPSEGRFPGYGKRPFKPNPVFDFPFFRQGSKNEKRGQTPAPFDAYRARPDSASEIDAESRHPHDHNRDPWKRNDSLERNRPLDYFALDAEAISVLFSLQAALVESDIRNTEVTSFRDKLTPKRKWYKDWRDLVRKGFENLPHGGPALHPLDSIEFRTGLHQLQKCSNPFSRELILLELAAFEAYRPLSKEEKDWSSRLRGLTEYTPSLDDKLLAGFLRNACRQLGLPEERGAVFRSELENVNSSFSDQRTKTATAVRAATVAAGAGALTAGVALPFIGVFLGHAWFGLAGAAAVKAGLAALGGGAIACGGWGIAGGATVIVGGGALLGGVSGYSIATAMNPATVLVQAVKMEVFLKRIVPEHENARALINDVLDLLEASISSMKDELRNARLDPKIKKDSIADREIMTETLETSSKRCSQWAKERGFLHDVGSEAEVAEVALDRPETAMDTITGAAGSAMREVGGAVGGTGYFFVECFAEAGSAVVNKLASLYSKLKNMDEV
jgi:hypothetical protein